MHNSFLYSFYWSTLCLLYILHKRIDGNEDGGSLGSLVNDDHRRPNCVMKLIQVDGAPHLCLFALVDLTPGTELRYNCRKGAYPWRTKVSAVVFGIYVTVHIKTSLKSFLHYLRKYAPLCPLAAIRGPTSNGTGREGRGRGIEVRGKGRGNLLQVVRG